jgi:nucleotide-binding universal stress UspA family protein
VYSVLIPLDGSRLAERSLAYVPVLQRFEGLRVTLLSVANEQEDVRLLTQPEAAERERNVLQTYLREIAGDMEKHLGLEVETVVAQGAPQEVILERARETQPDLLVISTHGRSGLSRWRLGSVADKVIRGSTSPTLVVGPRADDQGWLETDPSQAFKKLLLPLDASSLGEQAVETAQQFAQAFESELHLVTVVNLPVYGSGLGMEATYTPQLMDSLIEGAREYLARVAPRLSAPGGLQSEVLIGTPAGALEEYIHEKGIDLVVMTSHGRGGIVRAALGSVTDRLLGGPAPVLVIRAREGY